MRHDSTITNGKITAITVEFTRDQGWISGMGEAPVLKVRVMHSENEDYGIEATGDKGHIPSLTEIIDAKWAAHGIFKGQSHMEETKFE